MLNKTNLGDHLNLWYFYEDFLIFGDGSIGKGFKLKGKDISIEVASEVNKFNQDLENMLSGLDAGLSLQVFYRLDSHVEGLINKHVSLSKDYPHANYEIIRRERDKFLKDNALNGHYFNPEIYLFIRSKPYAYKKRGLFEKELQFKKIAEDQFNDHFEAFQKSVKQIKNSLRSMSIFDEDLSKEKWSNLLYEYFNLERSEKLDPPKIDKPRLFQKESLISKLFLTDIVLNKNFLEIGNLKFKTVSLKSLPESTYAGMVDELLKLSFHCWINQTMKMCNQSEEYKRLQMKRRMNHSMASGSQNVSDLESESNLNQIEGLLSELIGSTEKVVESGLNVVIWAETEKELEDKEDEILRVFKRLNHSEGIVETYANFDAFLKLAPGVCKMSRPKKLKISNLAHLFPVYSYWRGNSKPVCLLPNRDNVLVGIDPFARELPNWNGFIIGSSGSGKSFSVNQLILMFIGDQT